jgi:RNA polymerase sigma-70 factor (ECF subfamily)
MARVRAGDRDAFADLVERHKDAVVNYLTRLTGNRDRAEDLGQETFLRLYRAVAGYVEQGYLRAYLFRIATNLVRSEERRERRQRLLLPLLGGDPDRSEPLAHTGMLRQEMQRELAAAVARLPLRYRVPLVLHEIEGWSYADVAAELDCREGTIKSRIHRGRQSLKRQLESYWYGGFRSWKRKD